MKNKQLVCFLLVFLFVLSACAQKEEPKEEDDRSNSVVQSAEDDYSILVPFENSPLRQDYANYFREIDMMEIGSRLQEKSKQYFDSKKYYLSEGTLIDQERYYNLLGYESEQNPNGLNLKPFEIREGSVVIKDPRFVSDLVELNFHKDEDKKNLDGVAVALVLKRVQVLDDKVGTTHALSDDTLYEVGRTLGLRLYSYLSSLEGMNDVPIFIGLYVQESDVDQLPGKYLPGHYIGHAFFKSRSDQFVSDNEHWYYLTEQAAEDTISNTVSSFSRFKKGVHEFSSDENIGVIGKAFVVDDQLQKIYIDLITGSKTYLELYGLAQYAAQEISLFDEYQVPVVINLKIEQNTRIVLEKEPNKKLEIVEIH